MKAKIRATAQKLVNLYRQAHVIVGEWATVNPIFINEADDAVIQEISDLPTGKMLVKHIENLRERLRELDFILSPSGTMIYIGTPHAYDTIYRTSQD